MAPNLRCSCPTSEGCAPNFTPKRWILPESIWETEAIPLIAFRNQFHASTHTLKTEFPNNFDRRTSLAKTIRMKKTSMVSRVLPVTVAGQDLPEAAPNTVKTLCPNCLPWCHSFLVSTQCSHPLIDAGVLPALPCLSEHIAPCC